VIIVSGSDIDISGQCNLPWFGRQREKTPGPPVRTRAGETCAEPAKGNPVCRASTCPDIVKQFRKGIIIALSLVVVEHVAWILEPTLFGNLIGRHHRTR